MNEKYNEEIHLPDVPSVDGSYGDLIILILYTLIRIGPRHLNSFTKIITGTICNL